MWQQAFAGIVFGLLIGAVCVPRLFDTLLGYWGADIFALCKGSKSRAAVALFAFYLGLTTLLALLLVCICAFWPHDTPVEFRWLVAIATFFGALAIPCSGLSPDILKDFDNWRVRRACDEFKSNFVGWEYMIYSVTVTATESGQPALIVRTSPAVFKDLPNPYHDVPLLLDSAGDYPNIPAIEIKVRRFMNPWNV